MIKNDFCKIFGFEEFDKFLGFLKEKNCFNFCRKKIFNEICVHCDECSLNEKAIFCLNCFKLSNEKHFFHNKNLKFVENGICDCGNFEKIEKKFFCFEHLNEKNNFFLNENKIKNLNDFFCDLIKKIVVFINEVFNIEVIKVVGIVVFNIGSLSSKYKPSNPIVSIHCS